MAKTGKRLPVTTPLEMILHGGVARVTRTRNPRFVTEFAKSFMHISRNFLTVLPVLKYVWN